MLAERWLIPRVRESSQYVCAAVLTMLRNECYWWLPHARWLLLCPPYHQSLQSHDRHNLWWPQPDIFWCHVFVRWIVIAISSCSNGPLDMVHQLVLGLYNNLLAIRQAIVSDSLCISSKIYDIIQYLINKFFHSLPDWIFCFHNLVSCIFLNLEPLKGDWLAGYFVGGFPVVIAQRFGREYFPFSSSFSQWVRDSSIGRTAHLVERCNFLLA